VIYQQASNELGNLRALLQLNEREVAAASSLSPAWRSGRWGSARSWSSTWCRGGAVDRAYRAEGAGHALGRV